MRYGATSRSKQLPIAPGQWVQPENVLTVNLWSNDPAASPVIGTITLPATTNVIAPVAFGPSLSLEGSAAEEDVVIKVGWATAAGPSVGALGGVNT
jgi:hypothetical protein